MADSKWMRDLTATTPLTSAASHVLTVRLQVVRDHLPKALHEADRDPEHVHQLRVGTRRARAALDVFSICVPAKVSKTARAILRNIRRAAGEARDWDVFLAGLATWGKGKPSRHRPGLDFLMGYGVNRRVEAQGRLTETCIDYPFAFDRFLAETVAAVQKPRASDLNTLQDLARPMLAEAFKELDRAATSDLSDFDHLHQVRIVGKRLRYAMEIFADCFAPSFRDQLYPAIEEMQEILGNANDSHVACQRLEALTASIQSFVPDAARRLLPGIEGLRRFHAERLPRQRQRFEEWWQRWQTSGGSAVFDTLTIFPGGLAS